MRGGLGCGRIKDVDSDIGFANVAVGFPKYVDEGAFELHGKPEARIDNAHGHLNCVKEQYCIGYGSSGGVMPKFKCVDTFVRGTGESRRGCKYEPAGGRTMVNGGEQGSIRLVTEGAMCNMNFLVAEVSKQLGFGPDLVDCCYPAMFGRKGSSIHTSGGRKHRHQKIQRHVVCRPLGATSRCRQ